MSLSRKRKKELRQLQSQANKLWESQQVLVGEARSVAREAGRQLGNYNRETVKPAVQENYAKYAAPYVDKGKQYSRHVYENRVIPAAGAALGSALTVWDAANDARASAAAGRGVRVEDAKKYAALAAAYGADATKKLSKKVVVVEPERKGMGAGGVIAIILGIAAAVGVLYAAWQTLRADDELWVADDPLRAPEE
ncbi:DNA helicase [Microbacterium candidum]|uniref:DNA helicase n=1 Tax=Microbacterium candidum TaxID=3041922 RepID=A0ABT7MUC1_9MICO|nr:DNA helicase [Microbacterium sp. ASV49]MDL9978056.1 DNA helicase [Microbacterium sp. ASV49]